MVPFCAIRDELVFETCEAFQYEPGTSPMEYEDGGKAQRIDPDRGSNRAARSGIGGGENEPQSAHVERGV
jgi:hypothetical protein